MNLQQINLIEIAEIVDYCCNTRNYLERLDEEATAAILENPYCWKIVEKKFTGSIVESKKNEILNALETRFDIRFPNALRKLLLENSFCTFEDLESAVDLVSFNRNPKSDEWQSLNLKKFK